MLTRYSILSFFCFSGEILGDCEFGYWDWFVLGTRTFREGGVMIRWLWPLGRVWAPAIMPVHCFVLNLVVSLGFILRYINCVVNYVHYCMFLYMWL